MIKNLLFDLDGTLTDPAPGITRSIIYALKELGISEHPIESDLHWCIGPPLRESFPTLLNSQDKTLIEEAVRLYRVRYEDIGLFENEPYYSVDEILRTLKGFGHLLYLSTGKPLHVARRVLTHFKLDLHFHQTYGNEPGGRFDDKSKLVEHILVTEKLNPEETAIIGDRKHDISAGNAHGLLTIGVAYGYGGRKELEESGAHFVVETLESVKDIVSHPRQRRNHSK